MNTIYSKSLKSCMDNVDLQAPDWNLITEVNKVIGSIIILYILPYHKLMYIPSTIIWLAGVLSASANRLFYQQPWYKEVNALHGYKYNGLPSMNEELLKSTLI